MTTETGRVVGIECDALWVETVRRSTCNSCAARDGCGQGLLNRVSDGQRNHVRALLGAQDAASFQLNDEVEISVPEHLLVRGAFIVYLLPLLALLAGMMLADRLVVAEAGGALGAMFGFAAGLVLVRLHAWWIRDNSAYQPVVARRGDGRSAGAASAIAVEPS